MIKFDPEIPAIQTFFEKYPNLEEELKEDILQFTHYMQDIVKSEKH